MFKFLLHFMGNKICWVEGTICLSINFFFFCRKQKFFCFDFFFITVCIWIPVDNLDCINIDIRKTIFSLLVISYNTHPMECWVSDLTSYTFGIGQITILLLFNVDVIIKYFNSYTTPCSSHHLETTRVSLIYPAVQIS